MRQDEWRKCISGLAFGVFAVGLLAVVTLSASPSRSILAEDAAFQPWQVAIIHLGQGSTCRPTKFTLCSAVKSTTYFLSLIYFASHFVRENKIAVYCRYSFCKMPL